MRSSSALAAGMGRTKLGKAAGIGPNSDTPSEPRSKTIASNVAITSTKSGFGARGANRFNNRDRMKAPAPIARVGRWIMYRLRFLGHRIEPYAAMAAV